LRKAKHIFTGVLFLLCYSYTSNAIEQRIRFDLLSIKDGLSQSSVNCVVQDDQGFIWIGTQDGLNKYDGYSFTTYYHDPADSSSICDNFIRDLAIDSVGNLWVGTDHGLS
jgi:ligand-binding sensor domain-containing protein